MNDTRYGTTGKRREDDRLTTGLGQYTDDLRHEGALCVVFLRSPYPSAIIRSIDTTEALAHPGVVAVLTGADMVAEGFNDCPVPFKLAQGDGSFAFETPRPFLVRERVRFVGEPVAMVLAHSNTAALDAAELVVIDYDGLSAVTGVLAAAQPEAAQLWDDRPRNVAYHWRGGDGARVEAALAASHHVARLTSHISRVSAMPIEPRAALAYIGDDGRPVLHLSHQSPHQMRDELASLFRLDAGDLRVVVGDVGGSFGMKWAAQREEILVFWAALRLNRAVRWTALRGESFLADEHARDVLVTSELGLDADGRFTALRVRYDVNVGAYMCGRSTTPINNIGGIAGVYTTPAIAAEVIGIFTNTQATAAYRGAGRPDATYAIERIIDVAAAEMDIDPVELRRRNLIPARAMPYRTPFLFEYDCGNFEPNLDKALALSHYATFAQRREEAKRRGRWRGIGIAMPIEQAGGFGADRAAVRAHPDGSVTLTTGTMSVGQGHETGFSLLVAQRLHVPVANVRYEQGDTDRIENGRGNGGSSALIQGGSAVARAVDDLIQKGSELAADKLEAAVSDIEFSDGAFRISGTDRSIGLTDLALEMESRSAGQTFLAGLGQFAPARPTFPNGCHICEVEIDPETGEVTPIRYVSVEDVGRVLNPMLVEGQIHGGVVQGIGQALLEEIRYDESGQLVTGSFMDYAMPRAVDMPDIVSVCLETPTALNPLGVKGVGEAGTVGALSATINAVCHALQPTGIRHLDMPATPMRVWQALRDAGYRPR
ncbi:MAG: xanthine dehydrogenase family protein molybdopterin-binding subunit [Betaproteobacteria bacterium]